MFDIKEKNVLITGGKGQVGAYLKSVFEKHCKSVIAVDFEDFDVTSEKETSDFFEDLYRKCNVDVLINNAGISTFEPFLERKEKDFKKVLDVNLWGSFNCIKNYVKNYKKANQTEGKIINVGSIYGLVSPDPRIYTDLKRHSPEVYGASKAGLIQMTKYFAVHLSSLNIQVNCVSPGGIFNNENPQGEDFISNYSTRCPQDRMANLEDMIGPFLFLSSNFSNYVNGQNIVVDGGFTSW